MQRGLGIVLSMVTIAVLWAVPVFAITVSLGDEAASGSNVRFIVVVDNEVSILGVQVVLAYDPTKITIDPDSFKTTTRTSGWVVSGNLVDGQVRIGVYHGGGARLAAAKGGVASFIATYVAPECSLTFVEAYVEETALFSATMRADITAEDWEGGAWLYGFSKRRHLTIIGSTAGAQTDYPLRMAVPYDADMQADFDDIRFTAADATTPILHWRQSYVASDSAVFWGKLPSIPASPDSIGIYMYYGNPEVSSESQGDSVFTFCEDFEAYSSVTDQAFLDRWTKITPSDATMAFEGGELSMNQSRYGSPYYNPEGYVSVANAAPSGNMLIIDFDMEFVSRTGNSGSQNTILYFNYQDSNNHYRFMRDMSDSPNNYWWLHKKVNGNETILASNTSDSPGSLWGSHPMRIRKVDNSILIWRDWGTANQTGIVNATDNTFSSGKILVGIYRVHSHFDNIRTPSKYVIPEPTYAIGAEETY